MIQFSPQEHHETYFTCYFCYFAKGLTDSHQVFKKEKMDNAKNKFDQAGHICNYELNFTFRRLVVNNES